MAAQQMSLPGMDLASDEVALRNAWACVPGVIKSDFNSKIEFDAIRFCLVRVAEAQMKRAKKCRHS